jgi:hypothetical protein
VGGKPVLVDPGTFSYSTQPWRRYFRSTAAHNTVVVDDQDQSQYGGSFLWLEHANAVVETFRASGDEQTLTAHHDGYRRLSDPVRHRRTWRYTAGIASLAVTDELACSGAHSIAIYWHFAPECAVVVEGNSVVASRDGVRVAIGCRDGSQAPLQAEIVRAREEDSPLGWFSKAFDVKEPAPTAVIAGKIQGNAILRTSVSIERS